MADRPSRKRKMAIEGEQYRQGLAQDAESKERRKKMRVLRKEINTDLSDLFGKMQATDEPRAPAVVDVEMGRGRRRRKTRKASKKSRKTRRKH
jgi:hypothetical protein